MPLNVRHSGAPRIGVLAAVGLALSATASASCAPTVQPRSGAREVPNCVTVRWIDLNRPATLRAVNLLVGPGQGARATAERIRAEVLGLGQRQSKTPAAAYRDPLDSESACRKDDLVGALEGIARRGGGSATVTVMPLVTNDGYIVDRRLPAGRMASQVVVALRALHERGDVSEVVETTYGFHTLVLLDVVGGHVATDEEVSRICAEE